MKSKVFLALGSNLGDRMANLRAALSALAPDVILIAISPVYETPPWGYIDQPSFLNLVAEGETNLPPLALLSHIKSIERELGRIPSFRNGPRQIDIDILFYGDLIYSSPALTIPHPGTAQRAFVLVPLADLAPDLRHPTTGRTIREHLAEVNREGILLYKE